MDQRPKYPIREDSSLRSLNYVAELARSSLQNLSHDCGRTMGTKFRHQPPPSDRTRLAVFRGDPDKLVTEGSVPRSSARPFWLHLSLGLMLRLAVEALRYF